MFHSNLKPVILNIIVLKETRAEEKRVALTPNEVAKLTAKKLNVIIEKDAGAGAGFKDEAYSEVGAKIMEISSNSKFPSHSLILRVKRADPARESWENNIYTLPCYMMGFLDPYYQNTDHIQTWAKKGISTFSIELLDLSKNDPKNVFDRMSKIAGRVAMEVAIAERQKSFKDANMVETKPKVAIIGPGSAGISAANKAIEHKLSTTVFGSASFAETLKSCNYKFTYHSAPTSAAEDEQRAFYSRQLPKFDIVITTARKHKQKPPMLINEKTIEMLPSFAVVTDLCQGQGGNVSVSQKDTVVACPNYKKITNMSGYPKLDPHNASIEYAAGMLEIICEFLKLQTDFKLMNSLFSTCWLTDRGVIHPNLTTINTTLQIKAKL